MEIQGKLNRQIYRAGRLKSTGEPRYTFEQIEISILYPYQTYNNTFCGFF